MRIGLIGNGFVGDAFYQTMKRYHDIDVWDTNKKRRRNVKSLKQLVEHCMVIFVSVPTPMKPDGSCDTSIVESVLMEINGCAIGSRIVVIRSTVPPGTTDRLNRTPYGIHTVFNPEFLTEANHIDDFANQDRIILGGDKKDTQVIWDIYAEAFPDVPIIQVDAKTAEMVKYLNNCLATKVTFANEMKEICDKAGIGYEGVWSLAALDERVGTSHWRVPGPDGHKGFGGTCFPKDMNALIAFAKKIGVKTPFLKAVWKKNLELRPERDWERSKGRAVTP